MWTCGQVTCGTKDADRKCGPVGKMRTLILQTLRFTDDRPLLSDNCLFISLFTIDNYLSRRLEARCGLPRLQLIVNNYLLSHLMQARFLSVVLLQLTEVEFD